MNYKINPDKLPDRLRRITPGDVIVLGPCYTPREIKAMFGEYESVTILSVLKFDDISPLDKLWMVGRHGMPTEFKRSAKYIAFLDWFNTPHKRVELLTMLIEKYYEEETID